MDKAILEIVNNFAQWKGNPFTLAAMVAYKQQELDKNKLIAAELPEAAEIL